MMGRGQGWGFHQRSVEELVKSETQLGQQPRPGGEHEPPPRPRTWLGAAGVLGMIGVVVLWILVSDCTSEPEPTPGSPIPSAGEVAALMLPGYTSGAKAGR